jgi:hypothetical protein
MNRSSSMAGADAGLTSLQNETLSVLLNMILPPSADGRMPGAAGMAALIGQIAEARTTLPALRECLDQLDHEAVTQYGAPFAAVDEVRRVSLLDQMRTQDPSALQQLALETVTCYYQQDRVLEGLGMEARPPFPTGYQVEQGDLSLLKPVIARGKIYRDVS